MSDQAMISIVSPHSVATPVAHAAIPQMRRFVAHFQVENSLILLALSNVFSPRLGRYFAMTPPGSKLPKPPNLTPQASSPPAGDHDGTNKVQQHISMSGVANEPKPF